MTAPPHKLPRTPRSVPIVVHPWSGLLLSAEISQKKKASINTRFVPPIVTFSNSIHSEIGRLNWRFTQTYCVERESMYLDHGCRWWCLCRVRSRHRGCWFRPRACQPRRVQWCNIRGSNYGYAKTISKSGLASMIQLLTSACFPS